MPWPNLSSLDVAIHLVKNATQEAPVGILIYAGAENALDVQALSSAGFDRMDATLPDIGIVFYREGPTQFRLSELSSWVRNFDSNLHIDRNAGISFFEMPAATADDDLAEEDLAPGASDENIRISDVGEKFGGAKKDRFAGKSDEEMKSATASALWKYDFRAARDLEVTGDVAVWINWFRRQIPSFSIHVEVDTEEAGERFDSIEKRMQVYTDFIDLLAETFDPHKIRTKGDVVGALGYIAQSEQFEAYLAIPVSEYPSKRVDLGNLIRRGTSTTYALKEDGKTYKYVFYREDIPEGEDYEISSYSVKGFREFHDPGYAWTKVIREKKTAEDGDKLPSDRPHLDHLRNDWSHTLPNEPITAELLMSEFGFRGIEFGNWLSNEERRIVVEEAWCAFAALADTLGVSRKVIGLDGTLGVAFGSRGSGRHLAHYEPDRVVINLTRLRGAGSLAHEWGHALDYHLGNGKPFSEHASRATQNEVAFSALMSAITKCVNPRAFDEEMENFLRHASWAGSWLNGVTKDEGRGGREAVLRALLHPLGLSLPKEIPDHLDAEKFFGLLGMDVDAFMQKVKEGSVDVLHVADSYSMVRAYSGNRIAERPAMSGKSAQSQIKLNMRSSVRALDGMHGVYLNPSMHLKKNDFATQADQLDKKRSDAYWGTGRELFARAFESIIFDRLAEKEMYQDYLVHGVEADRYASGYRGNPYPAGDDRARIREAMHERLLPILQAMSSAVAEPEPEIEGVADSAGDFARCFSAGEIEDVPMRMVG